jgi:hypothetical protein
MYCKIPVPVSSVPDPNLKECKSKVTVDLIPKVPVIFLTRNTKGWYRYRIRIFHLFNSDDPETTRN